MKVIISGPLNWGAEICCLIGNDFDLRGYFHSLNLTNRISSFVKIDKWKYLV
jgi:hypothetical protein